MKKLFCLVVLFLIASAAPVRAEGAIQITANKFTNQFPTRLLFELVAKSNAIISKIALTTQVDGQTANARFDPPFNPDAQVTVSYEWFISRNYVPPGVTGQYWWTIQDDAGNLAVTPKQNFRVEDAAIDWKKLSNGKLTLAWYNGADNFGKALFDRSVQAMNYLQQDTGVTVDQPVQIWIYGNRTDFFRALGPGAREWTGGRAHPEYGIILINIETTALEWGKVATAHELAHIIIREKIRGPLGALSMPQWMDEGLAVYYETFPNKLDNQFSAPLKRALDSDKLLSLRSISGNFPFSAAEANLAYAEGFSVVDFIYRIYGRDKMTRVLQLLQIGGDYDDIFRAVFGFDTDGLENVWRVDIGAKPRALATRVGIIPAPIPTFGLSTDPTILQTPAPPAPTAAPIAPNPVTTTCGSGLGILSLGILGMLLLRRN
ncbi:MAG: hypothetical protein HY257_08010 [Chloroflexi bacterium]|nr:hypothetical protein [Chloroflexota bacterium]